MAASRCIPHKLPTSPHAICCGLVFVAPFAGQLYPGLEHPRFAGAVTLSATLNATSASDVHPLGRIVRLTDLYHVAYNVICSHSSVALKKTDLRSICGEGTGAG